MKNFKPVLNVFAVIALAAAIVIPASHATAQANDARPPSLEQLQGLKKTKKSKGEVVGLNPEIRLDAVKEAALSYGARGGLAWRSYEIRQSLEGNARYLDKVYDFRYLLIPVPSGFMIEPPIITESENNMLIEGSGQEAAIAQRIISINSNAKIVSTAKNWRLYLERNWGDIEPPPEVLLPETDEEMDAWIENVALGWEQGLLQADTIFEEDLNKLNADFIGMVRYRKLLSQGMVSIPYTLLTDRGVSGDGEQMKIGDRAVQITGKPQLITQPSLWQPADR